ncbi:DNA-directed RNA polymerase sigma-70 factor [Patiriisocius marinistellae]|uniref:DNA-directed RNA polymerase sigma-70 factor n=1 Tax=Patiriisocius marinistellae TaxID=2494560 RepID=A0A5J4FV19_9FLAO|nr:sigma-70 family RNA polymerase sigma factor [Patiriisocius marinistellae]GEQ84904.1 DNA-directed RNA polymerase sigma-70 factor [Patiriisocius marinistellae]
MSKRLHNNVCEEHRFNALFKKHAKDLHNFIFYKYGAQYNPKDKVQDAFLKLWNNCSNVPPQKAKSFLFTVANNFTLNEIAHKKVVLKFNKAKPKSDTHETPEFLMEEREYLEKVEKAIASLTEAERVAFLLNRTEGKKHREIAEILDISQKAVEKRIYSALKKMKAQIKEL